MRLLIYDPWGFDGEAATQLRLLIKRRAWHADWFTANKGNSLLARMPGSCDFREWILHHQQTAQSRRWRKIVRRPYAAFIGLGGVAAPLANGLPPCTLKIVLVEQLDTYGFVDQAMTKCLDVGRQRLASRLPYHLRVEADLVSSFDRILCARSCVEVFRTKLPVIEVDSTSPYAWQQSLEHVLAAHQL